MAENYDAQRPASSNRSGQDRPSVKSRNVSTARRGSQASAREGAYVPARTSYSSTRGAAGISQYSRNSGAYSARNTQTSTAKKVGIALLIIALVAALVGLGLFIAKELRKNAITNEWHSDYTAEEMQAIDEQLTGSIEFDKPFTMLLLGSDARSDDPTMGARTDTIILVRVDTEHNTISLVSIPRDTMVYIEGQGYQKFNAAYTFGGPSGAIAAVKDLTGVDIDHYAEINFEGLVGLIDAVGGVDVEVDELIDDPDAGNVIIPEGLQHLDGESALVFARSRAYADGDYSRQANQRKIVMALAFKMLETPATELTGLIQTSTSFVSTDSGIDFDFVYSVADQIRHNNEMPINIYSATIPSAPTMVGDISYVIADTAGVRDMMEDLMAGKDITLKDYTNSIATDIANAGGGAGTYTYYDTSQFTYDWSTDTYTYADPSTAGVDDGTGAYGYDDGSGAYGYGGGTDVGLGYDDGTGQAYGDGAAAYGDGTYGDGTYDDGTGYADAGYADTGYEDAGYADADYDAGSDAGYADGGMDASSADADGVMSAESADDPAAALAAA